MRLVANNDVTDEARNWVLRLSEGEAAAGCNDWRALDPAHDLAFQDAATTWAAIAHSGIARSGDWRTELAHIKRRRWYHRPLARFVIPTALAASLVAALLVVPFAQNGERPDLVVETKVAENRALALADGSAVTVGARSDVKVNFADNRREVVLERGQAFFEVAHDPSRPFFVIAGDAEIRVVGTKFDVRRVGDTVEVSVLEGRVEVRKRSALPFLAPTAPDRVLTAGETSLFDPAVASHFAPVREAEVTPGEWRSGRLYYADASLGEIVAEFNRYSMKRVVISDPALAGQRMTTSFRAGDLDGFVENLEATLGVDGRKSADGSVELRAR